VRDVRSHRIAYARTVIDRLSAAADKSLLAAQLSSRRRNFPQKEWPRHRRPTRKGLAKKLRPAFDRFLIAGNSNYSRIKYNFNFSGADSRRCRGLLVTRWLRSDEQGPAGYVDPRRGLPFALGPRE
jgi:hypothetical protein